MTGVSERRKREMTQWSASCIAENCINSNRAKFIYQSVNGDSVEVKNGGALPLLPICLRGVIIKHMGQLCSYCLFLLVNDDRANNVNKK
jgi:hypothetical protein